MPTLVYSTYLGGSGVDQGRGIAVDSAGNSYVAGDTSSINFPLANPMQLTHGGSFDDAFVAKLNPQGSGFVYSTYLGGNANDVANNIALDSTGAAYVTGYTASANFPVTPLQSLSGDYDAFITKLVWTGFALNFSYSRFLGGSAADYAEGIAVDSFGSAVVVGRTFSTNFPLQSALQSTRNGPSDVFLTKLTSNGSALTFSTYLGGSSDDSGTAVALDSTGNISITGQTYSTNFPTASAAQSFSGGSSDAFVAKLPTNGSALTYSTYLGGSGTEYASDIALSATNAAFVTGQTTSTTFPTTALTNPPLQSFCGGSTCVDAFVTQFSASGSSLAYSTFLGGSGNEQGMGISLDLAGDVYVTGGTDSSNFPVARPADSSANGSQDIFVSKLSFTPAPGSRTVQYSYDGLLRLIGATENPGASYSYAYDAVGNRSDVWSNAIPTEPHRTYDGANQVIGWQYDQAGNLAGDGSFSYVYDALNRVQQVFGNDLTTYEYNGDSVLVEQAVIGSPSNTTHYIQDAAAPLSQVLQSSVQGGSTTSYLYGLTRLAAQNGTTKTWYASDALGSVRRTLSSAGVPGAPISYDPWGQPQYGATPPTFGFTGELQDVNTGLVYLRARWYSSAKGAFLSRDPFDGFMEQPHSLQPYQYVGNNPVNRIDPTGLWWWGAGQALFDASWQRANSANVHVRIQAIMMIGRMDQVHAEYTIPGTFLPVDLLDSVTGEIWEIKPWDSLDQARLDLTARINAIRYAKRSSMLMGTDPNGRNYNWNFVPARWIEGRNFPTTDLYLGTDDSGWWDIYATQVEPGIILWWKHPRGKRVQVPYPIILPGDVTWSNKNSRPGWQPAPIPAGATLIVGTLSNLWSAWEHRFDPLLCFLNDLGKIGEQLGPNPGLPIVPGPPVYAIP